MVKLKVIKSLNLEPCKETLKARELEWKKRNYKTIR